MSPPLPEVSSPESHWELIGRLLETTPIAAPAGTVEARAAVDRLAASLGSPTGPLAIEHLPRLTCRAAGGDEHRSVPVVAAWRALRLALKLFDDVEDGDVSDHRREAINTATALLLVAAAALEELSACGVPSEAARSVRRALHRAVLHACVGQQADLAARRQRPPSADPDRWLEIAGAKSGAPLAWAAWAGALVAGADARSASCYHEYGYRLGVLLQVADDFRDVWQPDGAGDLARGCLTLPVCYALHVLPDERRNRISDLLERARAGDRAAPGAARQLLIDLGAQAYLLAVAGAQREQAVAALRCAAGADDSRRALIALVDRVLPALNVNSRAE